MKNEVQSKLLSRTLIYAFVIALLYYVTMMENYPIVFEMQSGPVVLELRPFFEPVAAFLILRYVVNVIEILFIGKLIGPIKSGISYLSFTIPFWLLFTLILDIPLLKIITFYLTIFIVGQSLFSVARVYSRDKDNYILLHGVRFLNIIFIGYILSISWSFITSYYISPALYSSVLSGVSNIILVSTIITAILSLSILFEKSDDPYVSYFTKLINVIPADNFLKVFVFLVYISYGRTYIAQTLENNAQYLSYIEWGVITVFALLTFKNVRSYVKNTLTTVDVTSEWKKHFQIIETRSDHKIDRLTKIIDDFIDDGEKDVLLLYLMNLLSSERLSLEDAAESFHPLIDYRKKDVGLINYSWNQELIQKDDLKRRRDILSGLLPHVAKLNLAKDYRDEKDVSGDLK